jgi:hypothetical protein
VPRPSRSAALGGLVSLSLALGCVPRAVDVQGEVVDLERGLSGEQVIARMGRRPDEVRRLGAHVEDWVYVDPEVERTFVLRMRDGELRWSKMITQSGARY